MTVRSAFYAAARLLGDAQAASRGRIGLRLLRRIVGRATGLMLRELFRGWRR